MTSQDKIRRDVLPIPDIPHVGLTTYDAKDPETTYPPIEPLRPPKGAPNVLIVLLDDAGFASSSAFGGPCRTPTFEQLAADGLRYNRFHTTALCSGRVFVDAGGLMSYGTDWGDLLRRSATLIDKILRGARPSDLPIEQPTRFELVVNLKTAKALGLTIPQSLLLRADHLVE